MVSGNLFHCRKNSWPPQEYIPRNTLQLFDFDSAAPPEQAWRRKLNSQCNILKEFSITFREAIKMAYACGSYVREEASHGRKAPIDPFTRDICKPSASQGVPLGGMGSGSISRGFRGEFRQWQIIPGVCDGSPVMANQFSIFISRDGGSKNYASVLAPGQHEGLGKAGDQGISSWGWNLGGQHSTYHALFPRAWTVYDGEPDPELKISCRQISPFIPHNYRDSSLPTAVFVYTLVNTGRERAKISLLFTWANSIGGISHLSGDHVNEPFIGEDGVSGVLLHHKTAKGSPPVTFAVAACETQNVSVSVLPCFGLSEGSGVTAKEMWEKMVKVDKLSHGGAISITEQKRDRSFHLSIGLGCVSWLIDQLQELRKANEQTFFRKFTGGINSYQFWLERHNNKRGSFLRLSKCTGGLVKTIILPQGTEALGWRMMGDNLAAIVYGVPKINSRFEPVKVNSLQFVPLNAESKLNYKEALQRKNESTPGLQNKMPQVSSLKGENSRWQCSVVCKRKSLMSSWTEISNEMSAILEKAVVLYPFQCNKALLFCSSEEEADWVARHNRIFVNNQNEVLLCKWKQNCNFHGKRKFVSFGGWIEIEGLPFNLWSKETFKQIGDACGGYLETDYRTENFLESVCC